MIEKSRKYLQILKLLFQTLGWSLMPKVVHEAHLRRNTTGSGPATLWGPEWPYRYTRYEGVHGTHDCRRQLTRLKITIPLSEQSITSVLPSLVDHCWVHPWRRTYSTSRAELRQTRNFVWPLDNSWNKNSIATPPSESPTITKHSVSDSPLKVEDDDVPR